MRGWGKRLWALACLVLLSCAFAAPAQAASPHVKIREVFPGSTAAGAGAEYVVLQTMAPGQNEVTGRELRFYDGEGDLVSSFALSSDVANGESQRSVLIATAEAAAVGATSPDFTLPSGDRLDPATSAVCLAGIPVGTEDCVGWGPDRLQPVPGLPDPLKANADPIPDGKGLIRSIEPGCPTFLDPEDDSGGSFLDFDPLPPQPRNNAAAVKGAPCTPNTFVMLFPRNPTNDTFVSFAYKEFPADPAVQFSCALDWAGALDPGDFSSCPLGSVLYPGPLADGEHHFAVRATGQGGTDASPDVYSWTVDTVPPQTTLDSTPPDPTWGFRLAYAYRSSETESGFECQLDSGPIEVCTEAKSYFLLPDGPHTFRVWATDNAGNKDQTPAESTVFVDNAIGDRTAPDTEVVAAPADPSPSSTARFSYSSSEPRSTFECRIAPKQFAPCPVEGTSYGNLRNAIYTFEVRATDRAGNVDSIPARKRWTVAAKAPRVRFTKVPGGQVGVGKSAVFRFKSGESRARFLCRLDLKGKYRRCGSPHRIEAAPGRHVLEVLAIDRLGNRSDVPALRIFRVRSRHSHSWFAQAGKLLSSFEVQIFPPALPRERFAPVALRFASAFENLDGTDTPALKSMVLRLAKGGVVESRGLPRCRTPELRFRSHAQALDACRRALVGRGEVTTAVRFPEGSRIPTKAKLLLFNASGHRVLMHIHATEPVDGVFVVPISIRQTPSGTVLRARFPRIAGGNGFLTGFRMDLERTYFHRGQRRSYLMARCPVPAGSGLKKIAFELGRIAYRFEGRRVLRNSSLNTCSVKDR